MKYLILSDTHGSIEKVKEIFPRLKGVDAILHLGDFVDDAEELQEELGIPVTAVPGNCDGNASKPDIKIYEDEHVRLLLTHGHKYHVNYAYDRLLYLCEENMCDAVLFGHTHIPVFEETDGIYLINPGSLNRPRDGSQGSYAIITTSPAGVAGSIVYYNPDLFKKKKEKPQGGFIKGLLNYSDRF